MQREEPPPMAAGLERIAAKARCEPKLRFTSLAHHITRERVWKNLQQIPKASAPGVDGQQVAQLSALNIADKVKTNMAAA
jgi:RNA-directed DNA polymerase